MHPIASWMAPIGWCDTLTMQRLDDGESNRIEVICAPDAPRPIEIDWPIYDDLAVRAVRAMEEAAGRRLPIALRIEKRIPAGAGLGGGSSDAAQALLMLRELYELDINDKRLAAIAQTLGSDVPFFLGSGPALVTGLGDRIERTPPISGGARLVVFAPDFGCATGAVYRAFDATGGAGWFEQERVASMARSGVIDDSALFNDLAGPAESVAPSLAETRARIEAAASVRTHVTGSGSAFFVVCPDAAEAGRVQESARRFAGPIAGVVVGWAQ
ncbi:MAG: hypothetical protein H6814_09320 [Phycisphaeraceae bacterium]|nr:hypothetical protein [Phycisphaeraceae bacterium]